MLKLRSRKAFTLLELVVALVVLGILAALAVPTYLTVIDNARTAVATSTAVSVATDAVAIASGYDAVATPADLQTALSETQNVTSAVAYNGTTSEASTDATDDITSAAITVVNGGVSETICVSFTGTVNGPPAANGTNC